MSRSRSAAYLAAAALILSLTACASEPWTLSRSSNGIVLRWYADASNEAQAHDVAHAYCGATGKSVEFGAIEEDGIAMIARYHCV
jgi:hypothetical protein